MYWFYIILFIVLLVIEAATFNLVTIWMAISALLTGIYAYFFPENYVVQGFMFVVLSIILIAATKPFLKKITKKPVKTNADRLIGEEACVTVRIDNLNAEGQVKVIGQTWSARSENNEPIEVGEIVVIKKIEGVKLIVSEK